MAGHGACSTGASPCWLHLQSIVFFHVLYCLLCLCGFAAYAGVINDELPDTNITSLRYGFGFGLVIILWLLSMVTAVWVWKTTDLIPASAWIIEEGDGTLLCARLCAAVCGSVYLCLCLCLCLAVSGCALILTRRP